MIDPSALDATDPLRRFRERFVVTDPDLVYLDGNSLGMLPAESAHRARDVVERQWGERLIRSWNEGWWDLPVALGDRIAPLVGAGAGEVAVADGTSVNLYKLAVAALRARPGRGRIVTDDLNFPSDLYILASAADAVGWPVTLDVIPSTDGIHGPTKALAAALDGDVALLSLSHVTYGSGYLYDMASLTAAAHQAGALALWDLCHAAGAVPVDLAGAGADLAVGCTYKYLNGGPGSPAFLYVREDLQDVLENPIGGWWGHADPFAFAPEPRPESGIRRFLTGTAPVLSMDLIGPGVDMLVEAGMPALREKSLAQTGYLIDRWEADLAGRGFTLQTPSDPERRGSHVSLGHPEALGIDLALINDHRVLPDFRPPRLLRLGIAPLTTSFADLERAVDALVEIVDSGSHLRYTGDRPTVT